MAVAARTKRKFRGLARARIERGQNALDSLLRYNETHADKELFSDSDVTEVNDIMMVLQTALDATIPVG